MDSLEDTCPKFNPEISLISVTSSFSKFIWLFLVTLPERVLLNVTIPNQCEKAANRQMWEMRKYSNMPH